MMPFRPHRCHLLKKTFSTDQRGETRTRPTQRVKPQPVHLSIHLSSRCVAGHKGVSRQLLGSKSTLPTCTEAQGGARPPNPSRRRRPGAVSNSLSGWMAVGSALPGAEGPCRPAPAPGSDLASTSASGERALPLRR